MFPNLYEGLEMPASLPHASGGVSTITKMVTVIEGSSPREWGCFSTRLEIKNPPMVFPTRVGVFLSSIAGLEDALGLPHASGGVSVGRANMLIGEQSSPREWGCFPNLKCCGQCSLVFPTRVGVFL